MARLAGSEGWIKQIVPAPHSSIWWDIGLQPELESSVRRLVAHASTIECDQSPALSDLVSVSGLEGRFTAAFFGSGLGANRRNGNGGIGRPIRMVML